MSGAAPALRRYAAFVLALGMGLASASLVCGATECDRCERFKGTGKCWECCRCQNSNCIAGCKGRSDYNRCVDGCSTSFGNCNRSCG